MIMGAEVKGGSAEDQVQGIKLFGATILLQVKQEPPKLTTNTTDHPQHHRHHQDQDQQQQQEMKRPDKIIPCPRCKSMETKFCYFNNYNVNQPRHFCKGCQRYWTAGGALRNVPVGAGRRKSKPPGRGDCTLGGAGFPGNCIFDASGMHQYPSAATGQFDLDRVMVGEWQIAAARGGLSDGGGFGDDFPAKRLRRSGSGGQTC